MQDFTQFGNHFICCKYWNIFVFNTVASNGSESDCTLGYLLSEHDSNFHWAGCFLHDTSNDCLLASMGSTCSYLHHSYGYGSHILCSFHTMALLTSANDDNFKICVKIVCDFVDKNQCFHPVFFHNLF